MDQLAEKIASREKCSEHRNKLIEKLLTFCNLSSLTLSQCVKRNMEYHDYVCNLNEDKSIIKQVHEFHNKYPSKNMKEFCEEIKYKNEKLLFFKSTNRILLNSEDVVTVSHKNYLIEEDETIYFNRATFTKIQRMFWWSYEDSDTPMEWNNDVDLDDGDEFNEIYVDIDDDYTLTTYLKDNESDEPLCSIPYIKATSDEMSSLINNLQNMGVDVRKIPDPQMNTIRSNLICTEPLMT